MPKILEIENCSTEFLGNRIYKITPLSPTALYMLMTGSAVNFDFRIPRAHRLLRIAFKHTASTKADSTDSLSLTVKRLMESGLWKKIFEDTAILVADIDALFGEKYESRPQSYRITANTTNTDLLYVEVFVQLLEEW